MKTKDSFFFAYSPSGGKNVINLRIKHKKLFALKLLIENIGVVMFLRYALTRKFWRMLYEI